MNLKLNIKLTWFLLGYRELKGKKLNKKIENMLSSKAHKEKLI